MGDRIAYVLGRFPVLSETFILREILDLRALSLDITCFALARGRDPLVQAEAQPVAAEVAFRPPLWSLLLPRRATLRGMAGAPGRALGGWWRLMRRGDCTQPGWGLIATGRALSALWLAGRCADQGITRIHAHFLGAPAQVGYLAARIIGVPFSLSAHASDVFTRPRLSDFDREIANGCEIIFTCSRYLAERLAEDHGFPSERIAAVYHGLRADAVQIERAPEQPPVIAAVGRLVEKKGFADLLAAVAILKGRGVPCRCTIIGEGPERPLLEELIDEWGLSDEVELAGAQRFENVVRLLGRCSVLIAPSVIATDGDMDGLPNVILEAAAARVPVVATSVSAIPEFVRHEKTGLLVAPHDPPGLADAIERVFGSAELAESLSTEAHRLLETEFDAARSAERLVRYLTPSAPSARCPG